MDNDEEGVIRIAQSLKEVQEVLIGAERETDDVMRDFDRIRRDAEQLSDQLRAPILDLVEANRRFTTGFLSLGRGGDLAAAESHFLEAQKLARELTESHPRLRDDVGFQNFRLGIDAQLLGIAAARADGEERERLRERQNAMWQTMAGSLPQDDPMKLLFASLGSFQKSFKLFSESNRALGVLDLEDAHRYLDQASVLIAQATSLLDGGAGLPPGVHSIADLIRGMARFQAAQHVVVRTLYDSIVGEVTRRHLSDLNEVDSALIEARDLVESGARAMNSRVGMLVQFPAAEFRGMIDGQRERIRNLRALASRSVSMKEITRRSSPRFWVYFAVTFLMILLASRWTGIVDTLGGKEVVSVLLVAGLIAVIASFGYEVGLRFLSIWKGGAKDAPSAAPEKA
jgi:hypothetical protein